MFDRMLILYRKEMLDLVRDRRTLISMILLPMLVVPGLMIMAGKFRTNLEKKAGEESVSVAVRGADAAPVLVEALTRAKLRVANVDDAKTAVENKSAAAGVEFAPGTPVQVRVFSDATREASRMAAGRIRETLDKFKQAAVQQELRVRGVPETVLNPFKIENVDTGGGRKMAGLIWGSILGYIVVLLMFSGGIYPAIDVTAGEKERRTLEVLLSSPASRSDVVISKILATTTAIFCTAMLSVASMVFSLKNAGIGGSSKEARQINQMFSSVPLDAQSLGLILLLLLPTAVMAASLMIAIAVAAKSFKEAQSYLTPVLLAAIFPLLIGMMPGLKLTPALALVPIFNVSQLMKEILQREYSGLAFGIAAAANLAYAAVAFYAALRQFNNERVLFRT